MNALTSNATLINDEAGNAQFVVLPYEDYLDLIGQQPKVEEEEDTYLPSEVLGYVLDKGKSIVAAWRMYRGYTQEQMAEKLGITQPSYASMEAPDNKLRADSKIRLASVLEVKIAQLDLD